MNFFEKLKATWKLKHLNYDEKLLDDFDFKFLIISPLLCSSGCIFMLLSNHIDYSLFGLYFVVMIVIFWIWLRIIKFNKIKFDEIWENDKKVEE